MATVKKKPLKKAPKPKAIQVIKTETVPLSKLSLFHKNPRVGNVEAIAESLRENGQYKAIVVNVGTYTGRPNEILGGNHTFLGMKANGEKTMLASFVDVDEEQANRIVLADNKTADLGTYDDKMIAELFNSLSTVSGTGYSTAEVEDILASAEASIANVSYEADVDAQALIDGVMGGNEEHEPVDPRSPREQYKAQREEESDDDGDRSTRISASDREEDLELAPDEPIDKMAELQVVLEIKEDNVWKDPNNFYGIPRIPESSILEEFPKDIVTWIGHEYTQDKPGRHFLYNYSLGGTKGLDFSRAILGFNTYDTKFISWWDTPAYNLSRLMVKGLKIAIVPDFSYYYTEARIHHLWGVYRANWLGRFFAEAGLKVIPRVQWDYRDPEFLHFATQGVPVNSPTLECSIQNINEEDDRKKAAKQLREILEELKPEDFMVYGGKPAQRLVAECGWKGKVTHVLSYSNARREAGAFDRKEGKASLSAKQKKALREKYGAKEKSVREDGDPDELEDGSEDE